MNEMNQIPAAEAAAPDGVLNGTLPQTVREGYLFDGWYTKAEGGEKISAESKPGEGSTFRFEI